MFKLNGYSPQNHLNYYFHADELFLRETNCALSLITNPDMVASFFEDRVRSYSMTEQGDRFFVLAVSIAARLHDVLDDARSISLQAMNAQASIARSGEQSRAMEPIVIYMNGLSLSIIQLVQDVDDEALMISRESLAEFRESVAVDRFVDAVRLGQGAKHMDAIEAKVGRLRDNLTVIRQGTRKKVGVLIELLSSIETTLLSANIVTSSFRIEVGNLDSEYRVTFESLIGAFEIATENIRSVVNRCKTDLATTGALTATQR